jgi:hypothetical protein
VLNWRGLSFVGKKTQAAQTKVPQSSLGPLKLLVPTTLVAQKMLDLKRPENLSFLVPMMQVVQSLQVPMKLAGQSWLGPSNLLD